MTVWTRYFKNASVTRNGLNCLDLGISQTSSAAYRNRDVNSIRIGQYGIRVWKRSSAGVETEVTSGIPVAVITEYYGTAGIASNTWACPYTEIAAGDTVVVRVYIQTVEEGGWVLADTWQTEALGPGHLDSATWTIYYYYYIKPNSLYTYRFYFGHASYNSRIEGITFTSYSEMFGPASSLRIYKQGAIGTPKSVLVTFTLKDLEDVPLVGKTVEFTVSLGCTRSPTNAVTDENGQASTTVTSGTSIGWAVVKGAYIGEAEGGGQSETYVEIAIYDEADSGDSSKPYQVFIQGVPKIYCGGSYRKSMAFEMQDFSIELPDIDITINAPLEVIIYRRGIKDFVGRITKPIRTTAHSMKITGKSNHWKMARRVVNHSYTAQDPKVIVDDVLTRYPTGVSQGTIDTFGTTITRPFAYETTLLGVIIKLLDITAWKARLNLDDSFDFEADLGTVKNVSFASSSNLGDLQREIDFGPLDTRTFLIGEPSTLVSNLDDPTAEATYGLVEEAFFDKKATTQAVLDLENQAILNSRKVPVERISGPVIDLDYAADAYDVFDWVTVTDVDGTGLSGMYRVVAITRNLDDCGSAEIELSNLSLASEDLLGLVGRILRDLSS
jgi:hypothetical protein